MLLFAIASQLSAAEQMVSSSPQTPEMHTSPGEQAAPSSQGVPSARASPRTHPSASAPLADGSQEFSVVHALAQNVSFGAIPPPSPADAQEQESAHWLWAVDAHKLSHPASQHHESSSQTQSSHGASEQPVLPNGWDSQQSSPTATGQPQELSHSFFAIPAQIESHKVSQHHESCSQTQS